MSSPNGTPPANTSGINGADAFSATHGSSYADEREKPRLTEEEKKQNHIASEQKRRQAIREGFDRLCDLVPGLQGMGRSEGIVLQRTVEYMRAQLEERRELITQIESNGGHIDDEMKKELLYEEESIRRNSAVNGKGKGH